MALSEEEVQQQVMADMPADMDPDLAAFAQAVFGNYGTGQSTSSPIGGFFNQRPAQGSGLLGQPNAGPRQFLTSPYENVDVGRELANISENKLVQVQEQMNMLGLSTGQPGVPDADTQRGFKELLSISNIRGTPWQLTLQDEIQKLKDSGIPLGGGDDRQGQVVLLPSRNEMKLTVQSQFREALDRDPTQAEMQLFVDELMADYQQAGMANNAPGPEYSEGQQGRVTTRVERNPVADFQVAFQNKYAGSIGRLEDRVDTQNVRSGTQQAIDAGP